MMEDLIESEYVFVFKHPGMEEITQLPLAAIKKKHISQLNDLVIMVVRWIYLIVL